MNSADDTSPTLAEDNLPTLDAIATHMGISRRRAYHHVQKNEIPHYKLGNLIGSRKSWIDRTLQPEERAELSHGVRPTR